MAALFLALSLLSPEGGGAERRRLASLSFVFDQPPALRASPFHRKGIDSFYHSPSFLWKEVPRRGGGWLPQRMEKEWEEAFPPFVILPCKTSGIHSVCVSRSDRRSRQSKRSCKEMRIHFFTAPFLLWLIRHLRCLVCLRHQDPGKPLL